MTRMRVRLSSGLNVDMLIDGGARSLDQQELMVEALALLIEDTEIDATEDSESDTGLDFYEALLGAIARHYASQDPPQAAIRYDELLLELIGELQASDRLQDTIEVLDDQSPQA